MSVPINKLVQSLLQKETLEQCSVGELQQLAEQYPYFDAIQLLLTKKLSEGPGEYSKAYKEQLQKTFLFFQNPLWLEHLLNETGNGATIEMTATEGSSISAVAKEPLVPIADKWEEKKEDLLVTEAEMEPVAIIDKQEAELGNQLPAPVWEPHEIPEQKSEEQVFEIPSLKIEPIDPARTELSFEPYYTVDYFASQGIKFNNEEAPKDKFGKQLKSFTEWLKAMKRLPASAIAETIETNTGQKVEQLAEHSIEDREVITEAMAEVWKKQGNMAKAIEVYTKLSLLDPSKSRYFAAQIDLLKKIN